MSGASSWAQRPSCSGDPHSSGHGRTSSKNLADALVVVLAPPVINGVGRWVRGEYIPLMRLGRCLLKGTEPDDGAHETVVEPGSEEMRPRPEVLRLTDDDLGLGMVDDAEDRGDHPVR